jgi:hypothetical protein
MVKKTREELATMIAKTMSKNRCSKHDKPIIIISLTDLKLGCNTCNFEKYILI